MSSMRMKRKLGRVEDAAAAELVVRDEKRTMIASSLLNLYQATTQE